MATRKIVEIGDEKLRKHAKKVEKFDLRLRILLKDMADTMYKADGGGAWLRRRWAFSSGRSWWTWGEGLIELVNPEIVSAEGEQSGPRRVPERRPAAPASWCVQSA